MNEHRLSVTGAGLMTDAWASVRELGESLSAAPELLAHLRRAQSLDPATVASHDILPQLAIRAAHQAWSMAAMEQVDPDRVGLIFVSAWGMIDSTSAYLESMFEADGRYASPRHFSRSVYCSATSVLAIHFQIHGPCETLAFDERESPVAGALAQTWRLLAADRADRVLVVWAEQAAAIALDLARRAAQQLSRHEYDRYSQGLGQGAVALLLALPGNSHAIAELDAEAAYGVQALACREKQPQGCTPYRVAGKPFAMDAAVKLLASILGNR